MFNIIISESSTILCIIVKTNLLTKHGTSKRFLKAFHAGKWQLCVTCAQSKAHDYNKDLLIAQAR